MRGDRLLIEVTGPCATALRRSLRFVRGAIDGVALASLVERAVWRGCPGDRGQQRLGEQGSIRLNRHISGSMATQAFGPQVDVDDARADCRHAIRLTGHLVQARADREDDVGIEQALHHRTRCPEATVAEEQRMIVREDVWPTPGGADGNLLGFGEPNEQVRGPRGEHTTAQQHDRPTRVAQQAQRVADAAWVGPGPRRFEWLRLEVGRVFGEQIFAQRNDDRARPPRHGQAGGAQRELAQPVGARRLDRPFGDRREYVRKFGFLEGLTMALPRRHLTHQRQHRAGVLLRGVDADCQVAGADHARAHAHRWPAGELAKGFGHEGGAALVSGGDDADLRRVVQGVEQAEEAFAGNTERVVHAGREQGLDDGVAAGAHQHAPGAHRPPPPPKG